MAPEEERKPRRTEEESPRTEDKSGQEKPRSRKPRWMPSLTMVGYVLVGFVLVGYFVWLCAEMSGHAIGGGSPIAAIFGGAIAALIVAPVGFSFGQRQR